MKSINKFFKHKRAFALSMRFLVIIILSLVVFGFGIRFATTAMGESKEEMLRNLDNLENTIADFSCEEGEFTCLNKEFAQLSPRDSESFVLKVTNYFPKTRFRVNISFDKAYEESGGKMHDQQTSFQKGVNNWITISDKEPLINKNQFQRWGFYVSIDKFPEGGGWQLSGKYPEPGSYIFNVKTEYQNNTVSWQEYELQKLIIKVD